MSGAVDALDVNAPARPVAAALRSGVTLFLVALALRLLLTLTVFHERGLRGGLELGTLADSIVAGQGFVWNFYGSDVPRRSFFPPFYPYLLAALKVVFGAGWVVALQVVQSMVSACVPLVVWRLGRRLMRADLALLAGWGVALWPPFIAYAAEVFPVTFHTLAVPSVLLAIVAAVEAGTKVRGAMRAGLIYGLTATSLPSFLGSILIMPLGLRLAGIGWRRGAGVAAVMLATALVVISPWSIRNTRVQGRFVPVATNLGFNLLGANNAHSRPYTNVLCAHDAIRWQVIDRHRLETENEAAFDRWMLGESLHYMAAHPVQTVQRMLVRIGYYWWISPEMLRYNRAQGMAGVAMMSALLPLAVIGGWAAFGRRHRRPFGVLYAAAIWMTLFYMNFAVRGRYSLAIHPIMILMAAYGAGYLWTRFAPRPATARAGRS